MIALLALLFIPGTASSGQFTEPVARAFFAKAQAPAAGYLESTVWTQIAGLPLYDAAFTPWMPGPVGEAPFSIAATSWGSFDLSGMLQNPAGLSMFDTISVPQGGGISEVHYPPGWRQTAKSYFENSIAAPRSAQCTEVRTEEPPDPYIRGVGILK
jgi:hypothetical protein